MLNVVKRLFAPSNQHRSNSFQPGNMPRTWILALIVILALAKFTKSSSLQNIESCSTSQSQIYPFVFGDHAPRGMSYIVCILCDVIIDFDSGLKIIDRRANTLKLRPTPRTWRAASANAVKWPPATLPCSTTTHAFLLSASLQLAVCPWNAILRSSSKWYSSERFSTKIRRGMRF